MTESESIGPTTEVVRIVRTIKAPPEKVYDAWMDPAKRMQWWCGDIGMTCDFCEIDPQVGGRYRVNMRDAENEYFMHGQFVELSPPTKIMFTQRWETWRESHQDSLITVELRAVEAGTELTFTHAGLPDDNAVREHTEGWECCMDTLTEYLNR